MKRVLTGTIFGGLLIGTILLRNVSLSFFDAFVGILMVLASFEICNAQNKMGRKNIKYLSMIYPILMYLLLVVSINQKFDVLNIILWQVLLLVSLTLIAFIGNIIFILIKNIKLNKNKRIKFVDNLKDSANIMINSLITFIYPNLFLGLLFVLNHLSQFSFASNVGSIKYEMLFISLIFIITFLTDIFAFCVGSVFGGAKLCPLISPKKTISGAIGGILASIFGVTLVYYITNADQFFNALYASKGVTLILFIFIAIIGSVISQAGDLLASKIKRKSGIKDFGSILPGHGGVIDRFDGVTLNTLFIFIISCIILL